ncbi:MAG: YggS family pyridoxal phosphate-dependent enzyme [Bacillaceae bacterium]
MSIAENVAQLTAQIEQVCSRCHRQKEEITVIAVTKTVDVAKTKEVIAAKITNLGENRPIPFLEKVKAITEAVCWHYIGSLQTRKVKDVICHIDYLHSLDRIHLAEEIQKRADKVINCFVQVKTSNEESKHGVAPEEVHEFIKQLAAYDKIKVVGLMTMAPYTEDEEVIRACFKQAKRLQEEIKSCHYAHAPCTDLSMGMSNDFVIAIEEGATFIRIGTSLVGEKR